MGDSRSVHYVMRRAVSALTERNMMETSGIESESSPAGTNGPRKQAVLVTGGTGFVGSWAVVELLRRGYQVRTTIRNLARESDVRSMIATETDPASLAFTQANLLEDRGWDESMAGVDFVLHVASPMPRRVPGTGCHQPGA